MDNFTIYTLGGGDILFMVFNAIASLFRPDGGSLITMFVTMGTVVGACMAMWMTVYQNETQPMLKWFVTYTILVTGFVSPISRVHIKDSMTNRVHVVDNVPFALAFGGSIVSTLGNGFTQAIEQVFQPSPTEMVGGIGIQSNLAPSYSKTGFIFGADVITNMKRVAFDNKDIEDNMHGFVNQCVTYDALIGTKYTLHDLKNSDDLWGLVSSQASQMRGFPWRDVVRDGSGRFVRSNGTEIITCKEGARRLNALWSGITHSSLDDLSKKIGINQAWSKDQNALSNQVKSHLPGAIDKLTNSVKGAADHIKQQLMISSILKGSEQKTIELGGSPNFEVRRAYLQQRETYQTIGHVIAQGLPSIKNVLEALLYCMFVFVMGLILLPNGVKLLGFYFKILLWLQLWAPLFAMLNFIMTEAMSWRAMSSMKGANGITIGNFVGLSNMAMDMSAIAGYLCSVIPILAWTLLERGGYAFVSMASNLMGVGTGAATQAATEKATGNYSFGNMSFENRNMNNRTHLKHDNAPSYSGYGHMMSNDGSSSIITDADGHQILTRNESHLPVSLNMAEQQETMLRDTRREAESFAEGEQKSATFAKQQANNHYLEIGKQAQHTLSSGTQFQDQETYNHMKEAADHYNRVEQISNKTGLSKEYINQKAFEFHAGGNVPLPGAIADIGGKISKSENKQMSASEVADSILELSKTTNFNDQHQKVYGFHKNKNVDIQDQELKQSLENFSSSYETSNRHEQSAHKSYEEVKTIDKEIARTQSSSGSINASYTQDFVDHVGAET
jgi:conjugal transfer mating pair stabilization protein TraG